MNNEYLNNLENKAHETRLDSDFKKVTDVLEQYYIDEPNNPYVFSRLIFWHWYLIMEGGCIGYTYSDIVNRNRCKELYNKDFNKFRNNSFVLCLLGCLISIDPLIFLLESSKEYINRYEIGTKLKLEAYLYAPDDTKSIFLIAIADPEVRKIKLNKEEAFKIVKYSEEFYKEWGYLGSTILNLLQSNIYYIYNNYSNNIWDQEIDKYHSFIDEALKS